MTLDTLEKLLNEQLRDLYDAEHQIVKALRKMAKAAGNPKLKAAFEEHMEVTKEQITRLEEVFEALGQKPRKKKCLAMQGLMAEAQELMEEEGEPQVKDAALIASAQRVEHYEIAGYGTVRTWAQSLGHTGVARLLQQTLDEEGETDKQLTQLAETIVNVEAQQA